ncbi:hypothetical protein EV207_12832 [Scopulibacillus darangshiensis]|uniref:Uncharacterized protein n=1 Tax=Scopulibacillus darangshiensis TaxID=442528 RepID=A0A4R2NPQ5_9BACL|nr:hypothetical protein [Scopulibacillus darangshiensis]TCP23809.1 hypothetical protein EV207_12832 [Scopulibacillus darangshiensis]
MNVDMWINGVSEAEIVREAIREYAKLHLKGGNSLLKMGKLAKEERVDSPGDLSIQHDHYLKEIYENEK